MTADPAAAARAAGRFSIAFLLDQARVAADGRHFLESLIFLTVIQANVAHLDRDPELQRAFSGYGTPPPDELRRPISVSAIANALRIPYETARRRVQQLVERGDCLIVERGVIVPAQALVSARNLGVIDASYRNLHQLYLNFRRVGALRDLPAPVAAMGEPPMRAVARVTSDYCLRLVDILTTHIGDLTGGIMLLQIMRANTRHLDENGRPIGNEGAFVPDELRRPVTVTQLAADLGIPVETARRHAALLVAAELAARVPGGGLVVPRALLAGPPWPQLMIDNLGYANRMFAALAPLGLLAEWDRAEARLTGTA